MNPRRKKTSPSEYQQIIRGLSDRLVEAQTPIRVLDAIKWDDSIREDFLKGRGKHAPKVDRSYYDSRPLAFDGSAKKHKIAAYATGDLPHGSEDAAAETAAVLKEALKKHAVPTDNVGLVIDTGLAAFRTLKLHRVEANIEPGNEASIALVRHAGFTREGFSRRYLKHGGRWRDHERWALLREDWRPLPASRARAGRGADGGD